MRKVWYVALTLMLLLAGCGQAAEGSKKENQETVTESPKAESEKNVEAAAEETVIAEEATEELAETVEVQIEDFSENPLADFSNEEWVQSLNLQTGTFLIFNDTTGERKVLEEGQEYKMSETDILAFWWPLDWQLRNERIGISFDNEAKYDCMLLYLNYEEIQEDIEVIMDVDDAEGNRLSFTVYLSK